MGHVINLQDDVLDAFLLLNIDPNDYPPRRTFLSPSGRYFARGRSTMHHFQPMDTS